jgi:hypothetical protein
VQAGVVERRCHVEAAVRHGHLGDGACGLGRRGGGGAATGGHGRAAGVDRRVRAGRAAGRRWGGSEPDRQRQVQLPAPDPGRAQGGATARELPSPNNAERERRRRAALSPDSTSRSSRSGLAPPGLLAEPFQRSQ